LPGASGHFEAMPVAALALIVIGGLWFLLWTRRWRWLGVGPVLAGIALTLSARQPDLLVAEDGRLVAIRLDSGVIALSNLKHDRFTQSVWVRRAGEGDIDANAPAQIADGKEAASCGKGLCQVTVAGRKAAIVSDATMLAEGCRDSQVVIAQFDTHGGCAGPLVIDKVDLARAGAISVTFTRDGPLTATVRQSAGNRPWTGPLNTSGSAPPAGPAP
jgi:competence protein ComEC